MIKTGQQIDQTPCIMPDAASQLRLEKYLDAAKHAGPNFPGLMLLSLMCYVDDETWNEAIGDGLQRLAKAGGVS